MTLANKITITRILLIPVFVLLAVYYGDSVHEHQPDERLRWAAIAVFLVAAGSDGIDGYIARRYNQRSRLGTILDPLADKGLLLAALFTLTFSDWGYRFPLWFPVLLVTRDVVVVAGSLGLHYINGHVHVRPRWTGKVATTLLMAAIAWVMLQLHRPSAGWLVFAAGVFTGLSFISYLRDGMAQLQAGGSGEASR